MILTESYIRNAAFEARNQGVAVTEGFTRFASSKKYDLFISHSFNDRELVAGLYHLFYKSGYEVYIDWIDDKQLNRHYVTSETANLIKNRIKASAGTAYISTTNSTSSKWCPWELGVADGMKGRVCILPVMNSRFNGQEYLGLYPYLDYEKIQGQDKFDFWVCDQVDTDKYISLKRWLQGEHPYKH